MIKVITFDLDGVYFPNGKGNFIKSLGKLGISEDEAQRIFLKSPQMNEEYKTGKLSDEEYWSWAINEWKLNFSWKDAVKLMIDGYDVDNKVVETIKILRNNGYKTAICSNSFPARINGLNEKFRFLDNFDIQVFSYEAGATKPDEKIFKTLVEKAEVDASSIVFADDNPVNLKGAQDVGITTFLYEGFDKYIEQLKGVGVNV